MAKRSNSSGSSGRRGPSRSNSGESFSGKRKSSGKPFKKSSTRGPGRSSSFNKDERSSFRKKDDGFESRSGPGRSFKKGADKPYKRRDENSSGSRKSGESRSFKKSDRPYERKEESSFQSGERSKRGDKLKKGPSFGLPYKRSYDKKKGGSSEPEEKRFGKREDSSPGSPRRPYGNKRSSSSGKSYTRSQRSGKPSRERSDTPGEESKGFFKKSKSRYSERSGRKRSPEESSAAPAQTEKTRLNKYIANSGVCSRREADELISMGLISVNGKTITELGYKVNPGDEVRYENKILKAEKPVYILLNKPKGYLTTTDDPQERNTVMHIVGSAVKERIYPVGRLDRNTTGLLLLTNDGDLAEKLMHPSYNVKKIYKVELDRPLTKADFQTVREGVVLEEGRAVVDDLAIVSEDGKTVGLEIHIGWNRVVRRIFEALGYEVARLDRSVYAGLDKKDLGRGQWRFLKREEIVRLKHYK